MFGGLDPVKVFMVLLAAVVLLGPERLPKAARQLGQFWRDLSKMRERLESEVRSALPDLDLPAMPTIPTIKKGAVRGYISDMMSTTPGATDVVAGGAGAGAAAPAGAATLEAGALEAEGSTELVAVGAAGAAVLGSARPGFLPATDMGSGRSALRRSVWQTSNADAHREEADVPAGWHADAEFAGYASGANFVAVPSGAPRGGLLRVESLLTLDEPSWN